MWHGPLAGQPPFRSPATEWGGLPNQNPQGAATAEGASRVGGQEPGPAGGRQR